MENDLRLCKVNGVIGYFHCWEHWSRPTAAELTIGGRPAGQYSQVYGIVEIPDGVRRVEPDSIVFCDEKNDLLHKFNKKEDLK